MIYKMKLNNEPYELIKRGIKTIELRLNDEKRSNIKRGDTVIFINTVTHKRLAVRVKELHYAPTFIELFHQMGRHSDMGFTDNESISDMVSYMRRFYCEHEEREYSVVGIEIESPKEDVEFPIADDDLKTNSVTVVAIHNGSVLFFKNADENSVELPFCKVNDGEAPADCAKRLLLSKISELKIAKFFPTSQYKREYLDNAMTADIGTFFIAILDSLPPCLPADVELFDVSPKFDNYKWSIPELPANISSSGLQSVLLHTLRRMVINDDISDEECIDYCSRIQYYDEDVYVDYENFDPDAFFHYVVMRTDCDDFYTPLYNVVPNEENYYRIRDSLLHDCDLWEYFTLLVDKYGINRAKQDAELIDRIYHIFDKDSVDIVLGI